MQEIFLSNGYVSPKNKADLRASYRDEWSKPTTLAALYAQIDRIDPKRLHYEMSHPIATKIIALTEIDMSKTKDFARQIKILRSQYNGLERRAVSAEEKEKLFASFKEKLKNIIQIMIKIKKSDVNADFDKNAELEDAFLHPRDKKQNSLQ